MIKYIHVYPLRGTVVDLLEPFSYVQKIARVSRVQTSVWPSDDWKTLTAFHMMSTRYSGPSAPTASMTTRLWKTIFIFCMSGYEYS